LSSKMEEALPHTVILKDKSKVLIHRLNGRLADAPTDVNLLPTDTMVRRFLSSQQNLTGADVDKMLRLRDDVTYS